MNVIHLETMFGCIACFIYLDLWMKYCLCPESLKSDWKNKTHIHVR